MKIYRWSFIINESQILNGIFTGRTAVAKGQLTAIFSRTARGER